MTGARLSAGGDEIWRHRGNWGSILEARKAEYFSWYSERKDELVRMTPPHSRVWPPMYPPAMIAMRRITASSRTRLLIKLMQLRQAPFARRTWSGEYG